MSVIPAQGNAGGASPQQTAWDLGQIARSLYDQWKNDETDRFALQLAAEKQAKRDAPMLSHPAQAGTPATAFAKGRTRGMGHNGGNIPPVPTKVPRNIASKLHFNRWMFSSQFNTSTTLATIRQDSVTQSSDPDGSHWAAIFDLYAVVSVTWSYWCDAAPGSTGFLPQGFIARELNNALPASTSVIQTYQSCKTKTLAPGARLKMTVKPNFAYTVAGSASAGTGNGWLNIFSATSASYYGTVVGFNATGVGTVPIFMTVEVVDVYCNGD